MPPLLQNRPAPLKESDVRSIRLCVLTSSFPRREADYAGHFVLGLARALETRGFQQSIIVPDSPAAEEYQPLKHGRVRRVRYFPARSLQCLAYGDGMPANLGRSRLAGLQAPLLLRAFRKAALEEARGHDAILSHWLIPCGMAGAAAMRKTGVAHVAVAHSGDVHFLRRIPGGRRWFGKIIENSRAVVGVSRYTCDLLRELAGKRRDQLESKLYCVPMGVDTAEFQPARARRGAAENLTLVFLGRLTEEKGAEVFLEAARDLARVEIIVAGEGKLRAALEKSAGRNIRFIGAVAGEEKLRLLRAADCLVLPSVILRGGRQEGLPTVILEAFAAGLPVVASDVGGVREVVRDGRNGFLVPPGDARALRARIVEIQKQKASLQALAEEAVRDAARYDWPVVAREFEKLLAPTA